MYSFSKEKFLGRKDRRRKESGRRFTLARQTRVEDVLSILVREGGLGGCVGLQAALGLRAKGAGRYWPWPGLGSGTPVIPMREMVRVCNRRRSWMLGLLVSVEPPLRDDSFGRLDPVSWSPRGQAEDS
jgi:hypothetical protein